MEPTLDPYLDRPAVPSAIPRPEDEAGWEEMLRRYRRRLERRIGGVFSGYGIRPRREMVEEAAQEVFCRLLAHGGRRLRRCRAECGAEVDSYLGRIAERVVIDQIRAGSAAKRGGGLIGLDWSRIGGLADDLIDPAGTPEDRVLARERLTLLAAACRRMAGRLGDRRDARILRLALFDGWTSREIARHLGGRLSATGVDSRLHRLRRLLAGLGLELPRRGPLPGSPVRRRRGRPRRQSAPRRPR